MSLPPSLASLAPHRSARGPLLVWLCTCLALLAWLPSARLDGWAFDDREVLERNPVVEGGVPASAAFLRDYWDHLGAAGHYRPLATLSLRLDRALHGDDARGYHLTNALLHAAVVAAAGLALLLLAVHERARPFPWIGLALFAVHPALADSVAWISGRTSMLCALGGLSGLLLALHWTVPWRDASWSRAARLAAASALGVLAALCSKEDGVIFAAAIAAAAVAHSRRALVGALAGAALAIAVYLALRAAVYGSPWPRAPHAPLAGLPLFERLVVGGRAALEGLRLSVAPLGYPPHYERAAMFGADAPGRGLLGALGLAVLAALTFGSLATLRRRPSSLAAWSGLLAALATVPMLQLVPAGALFAPRFLYVPLLLAVPLADALIRRASGRSAPWIAALLLAAALPLAWSRTSVYRDKHSFYRAQLRELPDDPAAHNELGLAREAAGDLEEARRLFERAVELDPSYGRPWSNLGRLALERGDLDQAERCFLRAVELGPGNAVARVNLGALYLRRARYDQARAAFLEAAQRSPGLLPAWRGLARAERARGDEDAARRALERALALDPTDSASLALRSEIEGR